MAARRARIVTAVALAAAMAVPVAASAAGPDPVLPEPANGEAAIRALGDRLPAVAAAHDRTASELRADLRADQALWVDRTGRLYFVDPVRPSGAEPVEVASTTSAATPSPDQAFSLHSRPNAPRVIFLDFDGHWIENTAWNGAYGTPQEGWRSAGYDTDGSPSTFTDTEREVVVSVWQRVAEDFAPFNVDVTTADPGTAAIDRSGSGDAEFGTRVLISGEVGMQDACGCGGFAYVGVYDHTSLHSYYQPAWVFTEGVGTGPHNIAEAASHEAGHNLGLSHDGGSGTGYYAGHKGWAPIMGVGYDQPITQWSRGEYRGATNREDDLSVMTSNGAPAVVDDHDSTPAPLTSTASGVISTASDTDTFSFTVDAPSTATITVAPAVTSPNLDARLEVRGGGVVLGADDPHSSTSGGDVATGMGAELVLALDAGSYTAVVDGVGRGTASTGYTDYGSLGRYTITLNLVPTDGDGGGGGTTDPDPVAPLTAPTLTVPSTATDVVEIEWSGGAGPESTSYTLVRETQHPKHDRWTGTASITTTLNPSGTITDSPGAGVHRYAMSASSGTETATSGWSEVTVTTSGSTDGGGGGGGNNGKGGGPKKTTGRIP